ncbi:MAG: flagellar biosynthesis protein FlhF [Thermoguttaceae bacterium]
MDIRTYRAATMHEALDMVRRDLGPEAAVLHTREVAKRGLFGWLRAARDIEVTASAVVNVPSRLPRRGQREAQATQMPPEPPPSPPAVAPAVAALSDEMKGRMNDLQAMVQQLCRQSRRGGQRDLPEVLFRLFTDLIEADLPEELARDLIDRVRAEAPPTELADPVLLKARIARIVEAEIAVTGPIAVIPGRRRIVALVGPTGVGKTTTIAKLAANYRLKEKRNVGLITVDTYRIAAVEQLRTYAEIIDLPMQVVSTPREMREAVGRMNGLDLILMDTAGRSPKDGIKIQELRTFLMEAAVDEVFLVLSSVAAARTLQQTAERFAAVGTTGLILTKLDEATGLGSLLPVLRSSNLPLGYLTNGQNVPDDIEVARPTQVARLVLGIDALSGGA